MLTAMILILACAALLLLVFAVIEYIEFGRELKRIERELDEYDERGR